MINYSIAKLLLNSIQFILVSPLLPIVAVMFLCYFLEPKNQQEVDEQTEVNRSGFDESVIVESHSNSFMTEDSLSGSFLTV